MAYKVSILSMAQGFFLLAILGYFVVGGRSKSCFTVPSYSIKKFIFYALLYLVILMLTNFKVIWAFKGYFEVRVR